MQISKPSTVPIELVAFAPSSPHVFAIATQNLLHIYSAKPNQPARLFFKMTFLYKIASLEWAPSDEILVVNTLPQVILVSKTGVHCFLIPPLKYSNIGPSPNIMQHFPHTASYKSSAPLIQNINDVIHNSDPSYPQQSIEWHSNSDLFLVKSSTHTLRCYSAGLKKCILLLKNLMNVTGGAKFSPFGHYLAFCQQKHQQPIQLRILSFKQGKIIYESTIRLPRYFEQFEEIKWINSQTVCICDAFYLLFVNIYDFSPPVLIKEGKRIIKRVFSPDFTYLIYGVTNSEKKTFLKLFNLQSDESTVHAGKELINLTEFSDQKFRISRKRDYTRDTNFLVQIDSQTWVMQDCEKYLQELQISRNKPAVPGLRTLKWCESSDHFIAVSNLFPQEIRVYSAQEDFLFSRQFELTHVLEFQSALLSTQFLGDKVLVVNSHDGWILYNYRSRVAVPVTRRHDPPHKLTRLNRGLVRLQEISDLITILHRPIKAKRSVVKEARSYGRINERVLNLMRGK